MDYAANLALFLLEKTGSVLGRWEGHLNATEQRKLIGEYLGGGTIVIDGTLETIARRVSVCFGLDYDYRNVTKWSAL
jgi:hypothetical protein